MKKILVPVDFSEISDNALDYAVELAQTASASITLLHVYLPPVFVSDTLNMLPSPARMEQEFLLKMDRIRQTILKKHAHLDISCCCAPGIAVDEIDCYAKAHAIDLIVVGTQGAGYLEEKIFGSTAASLIRMASCSVMTIDKNVHFKAPECILLATDFIETDTNSLLNPLKELAALFGSHIYILNIIKRITIESSAGEIAAGFELDHTLKHFHHTFFYSSHEEVTEGVNEFTEQHKMDMIVMIPHRHSIISRLFTEPQTHKMAFHSKVPLLTLH